MNAVPAGGAVPWPRPGAAAGAPGGPDRPFGVRWIVTGFAIIALFVSGLAGWSPLAPIDSAVVAPGGAASNRAGRPFSTSRGGVAEIRVDEGDPVHAGELLVRLDDTAPRARRNQLQARLDEALAGLARLSAEREGRAQIRFPKALLAREDESAVAVILAGQRSMLTSRQRLRREQKGLLTQRVAGLEDEIGGSQARSPPGASRCGWSTRSWACWRRCLPESWSTSPGCWP